MDSLIDVLEHPENVALAVLDKLKDTSDSALSLTQLQTVKGILIGLGILGVLIALALFLQQFHR